MIKLIDRLLDKITTYRLVLYYLTGLLLAALLLAAFGVLPYSPLAIFYSAALLTTFCWVTNELFSRLFKVPTNVESVYISAFILTLIISPPQAGEYIVVIPFLLLASAITMASKFLINIQKKHIFNPAALAVFATPFIISRSASWWVSTAAMLPFVAIGGLLMLRKLKQFHLAIAFFLAALITGLVIASVNGNAGAILNRMILSSPLLFLPQ